MSDGHEVELAVAPTPALADDLRWQELAEDARVSGLASIQTTAERWGGTLLAVTGLTGAVSALAGADQVAYLRDQPARIAFGVLAGLALLAAGTAVVLAGLASQGKVVSIVGTGPELRRATLAEASRAARRLSISRAVSIAILPLFLAAFAVLLYAPRSLPAGVSVTTVSDDQICARRVAVVGDQLRIEGVGGLSTEVPLVEIAAVETVDAC